MARAHDFHVDVFDFAGERRVDEHHLMELKLNAYDVVGISTYTITFEPAKRIAAWVRRHSNALLVMGGYHASSVPGETLRDATEVDLIVRREGEDAFVDILRAVLVDRNWSNIPGISWRGPDGSANHNADSRGLLDQNLLPLPVVDMAWGPAYATFDRGYESRRSTAVVSSRGCPKRCSFCSIIILSPKWRARSVASILAEIKDCATRGRVDHIAFQDANTFVRPARTLELSRALVASFPGVTWSGTATADVIAQHSSVLDEIGRNCAFLEVGIEAGNPGSLHRFNKRTTVEDNLRALRLLACAGIGIGLDFICFEPSMTFRELQENIEFLYRADLFGYWPAEALFSELQAYPGTAVRREWGERLGELDPHEIPSLPYDDPLVGRARDLMVGYSESAQAFTNQLIERLSQAVRRLAGAQAASTRLCQEMWASISRLRHLPYEEAVRVILKQELQPSRLIAERHTWQTASGLLEQAHAVLEPKP